MRRSRTAHLARLTGGVGVLALAAGLLAGAPTAGAGPASSAGPGALAAGAPAQCDPFTAPALDARVPTARDVIGIDLGDRDVTPQESDRYLTAVAAASPMVVTGSWRPRSRYAQHTVFAGDTRACVAAVHDQITCNDMQAWLGSATRAIMDAHVRDDSVAAVPSDVRAEVAALMAQVEGQHAADDEPEPACVLKAHSAKPARGGGMRPGAGPAGEARGGRAAGVDSVGPPGRGA